VASSQVSPRAWNGKKDAAVCHDMRRRIPLFAYVFVIALIVASFGWQMLHGICPVP
jgi:hypothetical protein